MKFLNVVPSWFHTAQPEGGSGRILRLRLCRRPPQVFSAWRSRGLEAWLGFLGRSSVVLGPLGKVMGDLGAVLGDFEEVLRRFGVVLSSLGAMLGRSWAILGWSWVVLGRTLGDLGRSWGALGAILGRSWGLLGRLWEVQNRSKNRSENRSEIEPDPDRPKTLWSYACNGFRGVGASPESTSGHPRKLSKPLSM